MSSSIACAIARLTLNFTFALPRLSGILIIALN